MTRTPKPFRSVASVEPEVVPALVAALSSYSRWTSGQYQFLSPEQVAAWVAAGKMEKPFEFAYATESTRSEHKLVCQTGYAERHESMGMIGGHAQMLLLMEGIVKGWRSAQRAAEAALRSA